jgi:type IV pilus assembly protein PilM
MFYFKKSAVVGLSFHADEIRLVKLHRQSTKIIVQQCKSQSISKNIMQHGKILSVANLSLAIKNLVIATASKNCVAAIAIPGANVIRKLIQLPSYLTAHERELEIKSNLEYYMPGLEKNLVIDYVITTKNKIDQTDDVLVVAAKNIELQQYVQAVELAGLKLRLIDIDHYALLRVLKYSAELNSAKGMQVLLSIDTDSLRIIALEKNILIFEQINYLKPEQSLIANAQELIQLFLTKIIQPPECIYLAGAKQILGDLAVSLENYFLIKFTLLANFFAGLIDCPGYEYPAAIGVAMRELPRW